MAKCICMFQEGQISENVIVALETGLKNIVVANGISDSPVVNWIEIPCGEGWTAGAPSTSSVVALFCQDIEQSQRLKMLNSICDLWTAETGCSINEIIAMVSPVK